MLIRILTYFIPFAVNFLNGGFFFITSYRFAQAGASGVMVGGSIAVWGIAYCIFAVLTGRIAKVSNALPMILAGGGLLAGAAVGLAYCGLYMQYFWMAVSGLGAAFFCTPFQLFAKAISAGEKSSGAVEAAAFYTLTWSLGFATGPLAFARLSSRTGCWICFAFALAVIAGVCVIAVFLKKNPPANMVQKEDQRTDAPVSEKFAMLARLGWIVGGLGTIAVSQMRGMWPKLGEELVLSQSNIACVLALVSYTQGFTGLALCRSKTWMFRRLPAVGMALLAAVSLLTFAFGRELWCFYAAALGYGVYCGCMYFYLVYHSLAHPTRSNFYVAGNETVVGITNMLAPLIGGVLVDYFHTASAAFVFAALITAAALGCQLLVYRSVEKLDAETR